MFKAIVPPFINKLDAFLLVKHPVLWMSRIHYVLWHGAVLWILSALLGLVMPFDVRIDASFGLWYFLLTLVSIVFLCVWIYRYVIFNKERSYGEKKTADAYLNFVLVFAGFAVFLFVPYPFEYVLNQRIAASYSRQEVLDDINTLNANYPYLVDSYGKYDTWTHRNTTTQYFNLKSIKEDNCDTFTPFFLKDKNDYPQIYLADAITKSYRPISDGRKVTAKIQRFLTVAQKYKTRYDQTAAECAALYLELVDKNVINTSDVTLIPDHSYMISKAIYNVCSAQHYQLFIFDKSYFIGMFYVIFTLSVLLTLYKLVYWRQFLLLAVIFIFYPIVVFTLSQLMPLGYERRNLFGQLLLLLFAFVAMGSVVAGWRNQHRYKPFLNIMNQSFYLLWAYLPFFIVLFLDEQTPLFHKDRTWYNVDTLVRYNDALRYYVHEYWRAEFERWLWYAQLFGISSFLVLLPFLKELFVKQLALPRKV